MDVKNTRSEDDDVHKRCIADGFRSLLQEYKKGLQNHESARPIILQKQPLTKFMKANRQAHPEIDTFALVTI